MPGRNRALAMLAVLTMPQRMGTGDCVTPLTPHDHHKRPTVGFSLIFLHCQPPSRRDGAGRRYDRPVVIFRDARREDVPAIVALLADDILGAGREGSLDDAYWKAFEQIAADPRNRLVVAEAAGQVAGTLQLTLLPGMSRHGMLRAQIEAVRIAAPQRGQGLGRAMIEWAIAQAREQGCGLVQLTSDKHRPDAVRFYESLGFTASHEGLKLPL
jgi:GNAT superfamily N-acetyltransferase